MKKISLIVSSMLVAILQTTSLQASVESELVKLNSALSKLEIKLVENQYAVPQRKKSPQEEKLSKRLHEETAQKIINKWRQDAENLEKSKDSQAAETLLRDIINKNETDNQALFDAQAKQEDNIVYAINLIGFLQPQLNILTSYALLLIKKNTKNFGKDNYSSKVTLDAVKRNGEKKLKEWKQEQQRTKVAAGNPEEELSAAIQKRARRQSTGAIFTLPPQQPQEEAPEESELEKRLKKRRSLIMPARGN